MVYLWFYISVLGLLVVSSVIDLRWRTVPNSIPALIAMATITLAAFLGLLSSWQLWTGFAVATILAIGLSAGFNFGAGDGKLIVSLGGIFGPIGILQVVCWMAIAGLGLALVAKARGKSDFAYVPAILCGVVIQLLLQQSGNG